MSVMEENLKRDICDLQEPGIDVDDIDTYPSPDPLSRLKYSCVHWIDHLEQVQFQDRSHYQAVRLFIEKSLLHWLEAMSLQRKMEEAIWVVEKLRSLMQNTKDYELDTLTEDIDRFVQVHGETIGDYPLQTYIYALLFSPTDSCVRRFYRGEEPDWVSLKSNWETTGSPQAKSLLMLAPPSMLAISTDGNLLACIGLQHLLGEEWEECFEGEWEWGADYPHAQHPSSLLEIWDLNSDGPTDRLGLDFNVLAIGFLRDGKRLALAGNPNRFEIWNAETGSRLQTLQSPDEPSVCFTSLAVPTSTYLGPVKRKHDSTMNGDLIVSGSDNGAVRFWNPATGDCIRSIRTSGERVGALKFLHDSQKLAVGLGNGTVEVWDFRSGALVWKLKAHDDSITSMAFLGDDQLASTSERDGTRIWDLKTGGCIRTPRMKAVPMVVSLGSGGLFASAAYDEQTVRIWNNKGDCIQRFEGIGKGVNDLVFCPEKRLLASAAAHAVHIWDLKLFPFIDHIPLHIGPVLSTTLSSDSLLLASGSDDSIKIWNTANSTCIRSIDCDGVGGRELAFSPNSRYLVSRCRTGHWRENLTKLTIWNADDGQVVKTFLNVREWEAFSPDGRLLALALDTSIVMVWDMDVSQQHHQIQCSATCVAFSAGGNKLALASDTKLEIWDMSNGECIWTVDHQQTRVTSITLSADTQLLAAASKRGIDVWDVSDTELRVSISTGVDAVAFSPNRDLLAWIHDDEIGMRNLKDGGETRFLHTGNRQFLRNRHIFSDEWFSSDLSGRATIQFKRPDCSRLCTPIGDLDIRNVDGAITGFYGYHLDRGHEWIVRGKERMVLLPEEYQGGPASILSGQTIAIGGWNGGILFFQLV